jgi:hypothetical protein
MSVCRELLTGGLRVADQGAMVPSGPYRAVEHPPCQALNLLVPLHLQVLELARACRRPAFQQR